VSRDVVKKRKELEHRLMMPWGGRGRGICRIKYLAYLQKKLGKAKKRVASQSNPKGNNLCFVTDLVLEGAAESEGHELLKIKRKGSRRSRKKARLERGDAQLRGRGKHMEGEEKNCFQSVDGEGRKKQRPGRRSKGKKTREKKGRRGEKKRFRK